MSQEASSCPDCGAAVTDGFHFCPSCGIRLIAAPAEPGWKRSPQVVPREESPAAEPKAERRLVSVLFVDLVGFTTLSEQLDPEDVRETQSRYFELARSTVARYGGSLEKFIGDAVMAVWGSPVARENDAERSVRAAVELVRNVGSIAALPAMGGRLVARGAVTTGEAAVSFDITGGEGMVTGDMVNTASRLQEAASPGTVLVDDATRRTVGDAARFQVEGEKELKGKASAVRAWQVMEVVGPEGAESAAGHRGPFVGRVAEMTALSALASSVRDERRTTLVSIVGVAGIGKSRLGRELERTLRESMGARWYRGRPPRWGHGSAFAPITEMLRRSLAVGEDDPIEVVRRTLGEALHRLIADDHERAWLEPRILTLLGGPTEIQSDRDELFAAWRRYLEADTADGILVLAFEDLQWADAETLDFIEYLATWSRRHPILIIALARPELLEERPTWGAGLPQFTSMHLDPLADAEIDALLAALAPRLANDVAAAVRRRAEGVPLYAVEIARMMTERAAEEGHAPAASLVPESLHALLSARIDALPVRERRVLLMAAVLGRRFRLEALASLAGMERRELGAVAGTLVRRELLAMDEEPSSPGRGQLSFVQDLMREVAYGTLTRRDRRRYHLAVIKHLEAAHDPDLIEPLAEHLVAAHRTIRTFEPEAQDISRRAFEALRQAATHASALHAPQRALAHLQRALELATDPAKRADVAEAAGRSARAAARFSQAESYLREAIDLRESLGDVTSAIRDRAHLASVLLQAQHTDSALAELEAAWQAYDAAGDGDDALLHLAAELARAHVLRGDAAEAIDWAQRAIEASATDGGVPDSRAMDARISLGTALVQADRAEEGLAELRKAVEEAARSGLAPIELRARTNLAWLMAGDDPLAAAKIAGRGLEISRQVGSEEWMLQFVDITGFIAIETGQWESAISALDDVAGIELPAAYRLDFAAMRATIGALRGDVDALAPLESLEPSEPDLDPHPQAWTDSARAIGAMVDGDLESALRLAKAAASRSVGLERAEALALWGRIATWAGDADAASEALAGLEGEAVWGRAAAARRRSLRVAVETLRNGEQACADDEWAAVLADWRALSLPYREALSLSDRWMLCADPNDRDAATRILDGLGARAVGAFLASRAQ